jgi:uncharacterized protein (DUF924 family)
MLDDPRIDDLLSFWFGPPDQTPEARGKRWFMRDAVLDEEIRARYGALAEAAAAGQLAGWLDNPRGSLALVVLLDQFSRNLYRDSPRAFAQDPQALAITRAALGRGHERALSWLERYMLLMPFMHAEDVAVQRESVAVFEELLAEAIAAGASASDLAALTTALDFARRHAAIVERFGRYPHRNAVLGRPSTDEELEFLRQPGSSF